MAAAAEPGRWLHTRLLQSQSVGARLARNTAWSIGGSVSSQGSALLTALLVARLLGVSEFGKLALVQATVLLLATVGELGLSLTTTKFVGQWRALDPDRAGKLIGWSLRVMAASGCLMGVLMVGLESQFVPASSGGMTAEIRVACGLLFFEMLNRVQLGAMAGLEAFDGIARVQVVRGLLMLPCVVAGAWWAGVAGALGAYGFVGLVTFAIGHLILARRCESAGIRVRYRGSLEPGIVSTSASMWSSALLMTGSTWIVSVLLSGRPSGLFELGIYNAADKWKTALLFLPNMLFQVNLPMLAHSRAAKDHGACRRIVAMGLGLTLGVTCAGAIGVYLLAPFLMSIYGNGFAGGAKVLMLAAFVAIVSALYTVGSGILWALGSPSQMLAIDVLKTSLLLTLCFAGFAATAWGLTLSYLFSLSLGATVVLLVIRRQLQMDER